MSGDMRKETSAVLTVNSLGKLLVNVLERCAGLEPGRVLLEGETRPRPGAAPGQGLYCTIRWNRFEPLAQNHGEYWHKGKGGPGPSGPPGMPDTPGTEDVLYQRLRNETWCECTVSFWGKGAIEAALAALSALQNDERQFDVWRVLGYGGVDWIREAGAPHGGQFRPAASFGLAFYACFGAEYPANWFDASQWDLALHGEQSPDECLIPDPEPCPKTDKPSYQRSEP